LVFSRSHPPLSSTLFPYTTLFRSLCRYCSATFTRFSLKITTLCHSVRSTRSPVFLSRHDSDVAMRRPATGAPLFRRRTSGSLPRSEEHTSELQSRENLVCRLLLEK